MSEEYHVINTERPETKGFWVKTPGRIINAKPYSVCLVEPPRPALEPVKQVLKRIGYFAAVLWLTACGSNPFAGEEHSWSGVTDDPRYEQQAPSESCSEDTLPPEVIHEPVWPDYPRCPSTGSLGVCLGQDCERNGMHTGAYICNLEETDCMAVCVDYGDPCKGLDTGK